MPICYPFQSFGPFNLAVGFTVECLHDLFGFDFGERYHKDVPYRIRTTMEIDRAIFERYGALGLGYETPFPRITIQPFGHRFMPVMYGCECHFAPNMEPWVQPSTLSREAIEALEPWTVERFERAAPVREVLDQARQVRALCDRLDDADAAFAPHYRMISSRQNLGSVINTAFSTQGDALFMDYLTNPDLVRRLYGNIAQLTDTCLYYFPTFDNQPLTDICVGNCSVSMISPQQYLECNREFDQKIMEYARRIGTPFRLHQDSDVNPHLANYARFDYLHGIDFGQDTDFEQARRLLGPIHANCILFPGWIQAHGVVEIREQLDRLMRAGLAYQSFSFTLKEIDTSLAGDRIHELYDIFRECALKYTGRS